MPSSPAPTHNDLTRGYPVALTSAVILSTTAIFIRHLTQTYQLPSLVLAFWREFFVAITLAAVLAIKNPVLLKLPRQHTVYLITYGVALALFNSLWTLSVALNGAAVSTVLVYSSAGFTALLGWWLLKERLGLGQAGGDFADAWGLRAGFGCHRPSRLARQSGRHPDRGTFRGCCTPSTA